MLGFVDGPAGSTESGLAVTTLLPPLLTVYARRLDRGLKDGALTGMVVARLRWQCCATCFRLEPPYLSRNI
jgi:hypothetical protein